MVSTNYEPQGRWYYQLYGCDVYVVGPENAPFGIVAVHDLLGLTMPIIQGADILSRLTGSTVFVPDLFKGRPFRRLCILSLHDVRVKEILTL